MGGLYALSCSVIGTFKCTGICSTLALMIRPSVQVGISLCQLRVIAIGDGCRNARHQRQVEAESNSKLGCYHWSFTFGAHLIGPL